MYNCLSLTGDQDWNGPVIDLNRNAGMHAHHGSHLTTVRDGWRRAARWGCDEVADEVAQAAGLRGRHPPATSVLRAFADDIAAELRAGRHARWLNGMLNTAGYGTGLRVELFESFPDLATPDAPGDEGFHAEVYRHWFLVDQDERPLKHRYLERAVPLVPPPP